MDWSPLWLSLKVAGWATVFSVGIGLLIAYPLARRRFPGRGLLDGLVNLPLVLPPTVLGYALLVGLGRQSVIGQAYEHVFGQTLVFTWQGAVVASCLSSLPLFVSHARVSLAAVDSDLVDAARLDGAGFWGVLRGLLLPLARSGLIAGTTLAFARALGEFGATLMFAGDTPGLTRTLPLAVYAALQDNDLHTVRVFGGLSVLLCLAVCLLASRLGKTAP